MSVSWRMGGSLPSLSPRRSSNSGPRSDSIDGDCGNIGLSTVSSGYLHLVIYRISTVYTGYLQDIYIWLSIVSKDIYIWLSIVSTGYLQDIYIWLSIVSTGYLQDIYIWLSTVYTGYLQNLQDIYPQHHVQL